MSRPLFSSTVLFLGIASLALAQDTPAPAPANNSGQVRPPGSPVGQPDTSATTSAQSAAPTPPPPEPYVLEDGGFSVEPIYWLNRAQPSLHGGAAATEFGSLPYPGDANRSLGAEVSFPAGRSNSLRFSYFRVQGNGNSTIPETADIFSEGYDAGDYVTASYNLQSFKASWDYLSYSWNNRAGKIRFKTLYEVQYDTISTTVFAPFKAQVTDSSGTTDTNVANGSKSLILPTLGVEFEQGIGRHFRWEAKGSGFGIPHHANIWDAQADIAVRVAQFEIIAGEKAYHFKTSSRADEYFVDTLSGAFVGIRYYLGRRD